MTDDIAKVISKIKKLLALANGGATEAEAELAMRRAHEFLARHNLSMGDVEGHDEDSDDRKYDGDLFTRKRWEVVVYQGVAEMNFCYFLISRVRGRGTRLIFVGKPVNIQITKDMSSYVIETIMKLARNEASRYPTSDRKLIRKSFRLGASTRMYQRCAEIRREREAANTASSTGEKTNLPALASLYATEEERNEKLLASMGIVPKTSRRRSGRGAVDVGAYNAGRDAADRIGLHGQVGGRKRAAIEKR